MREEIIVSGRANPFIDPHLHFWLFAMVANTHFITPADWQLPWGDAEGVVGEKPYLKPGEQFVYTSGTMLETSVGTMRGSYQMISEDGTTFDAAIDEFVLSTPRVLH